RLFRLHTRLIHATPVASKTVKEKVTEVADKVNKKVGKGLADAIETGERATAKTKETLGKRRSLDLPFLLMGSSTGSAEKKTKQTAQHTSEQTKQKANEVSVAPPVLT
ncbi:hypothetical protein F5I97DRAFT_1814514, partial [Phlebopus sp. FC_14]